MLELVRMGAYMAAGNPQKHLSLSFATKAIKVCQLIFFSFFLTGGPFKCATCVASTEEECNSNVRIVVCGEGLDRCLATRYLKKDHFSRGCGNEIIFEQQKAKCAAESCEVSMCTESYCVA